MFVPTLEQFHTYVTIHERVAATIAGFTSEQLPFFLRRDASYVPFFQDMHVPPLPETVHSSSSWENDH